MNNNEQTQKPSEVTGKPQANKMSFSEAFGAVFSNFFSFNGRARRKEYWSFMLLYFVIIVLAMYLDVSTGLNSYTAETNYGPIFTIVYLILLVPWIAVTIRRLHDCGYGWSYILWYFLPMLGGIIVFIATIEDSQKEANEYGESPKYGEPEDEW